MLFPTRSILPLGFIPFTLALPQLQYVPAGQCTSPGQFLCLTPATFALCDASLTGIVQPLAAGDTRCASAAYKQIGPIAPQVSVVYTSNVIVSTVDAAYTNTAPPPPPSPMPTLAQAPAASVSGSYWDVQNSQLPGSAAPPAPTIDPVVPTTVEGGSPVIPVTTSPGSPHGSVHGGAQPGA